MKTLCQQCVKIWAQSHLGMSICVFLYVYICIFVYLWICILWQCSANTTRCARTRRGIIVTEDWVVTQTPEMEMQDGKWKSVKPQKEKWAVWMEKSNGGHWRPYLFAWNRYSSVGLTTVFGMGWIFLWPEHQPSHTWDMRSPSKWKFAGKLLWAKWN